MPAAQPEMPARAPSASSSSMKMMQGALARAWAKRSRRARAADADEHFDEFRAIDRKEGTPASPATARASSVFPVPAGRRGECLLGCARRGASWVVGSFQESHAFLAALPWPRRRGDIREADLDVLFDKHLACFGPNRHERAEALPHPSASKGSRRKRKARPARPRKAAWKPRCFRQRRNI